MLIEAIGLASLRMAFLPENYPPERREAVWLAGTAAFTARRMSSCSRTRPRKDCSCITATSQTFTTSSEHCYVLRDGRIPPRTNSRRNSRYRPNTHPL